MGDGCDSGEGEQMEEEHLDLIRGDNLAACHLSAGEKEQVMQQGGEHLEELSGHLGDNQALLQMEDSGVFSGYDLRNNENVTTEGAGLYSAHLFSKKAGEVIRKHDRQTPLFLYLAFQGILKPLQVPDKYAWLYQPYRRLTKESRRRGMVTALDDGACRTRCIGTR